MKVYPDHKQIVLAYRGDVANLLSKEARKFDTADGQWLAIPHREDTVKLLRNLGENPAAPIQYYYDWAGGTPFDSQRVTADLFTTNSRVYCLSQMGVGKTRAAVYAYDWLRSQGMVRKLLVAAPLSTLVTVWQNEIFENFHHLTSVVLHHETRKRRVKMLAVDADVYIINHDGVKVIQQELWDRTDVDCIILDELAVYRNKGTDRWKYIKPLVHRSKYTWGMTGDPTPNEPTDAYGQVKLLTPANLGYSFKAFQEQTMRKVSQFRWVPKPDAIETVYRTMQPGIRFTRDQCFDLPPTTFTYLEVPVDAKAQLVYKKMMEELAVQVRANQVTAANEGVKLSKLLQISSGFVYGVGGKPLYVGGIGRIKEIIASIQASQTKVIVFAPFRYYVDLLFGVLNAKFVCAKIHGGVSKADRDAAFIGFQRSLHPHVLVAHPGTMAHGLTLTAASTIIWAGPPPSAEIYHQANARITRPGQKHNTHIIHLQGTKAEQNVYMRLKRRAKVSGALLEMFETTRAGAEPGHDKA